MNEQQSNRDRDGFWWISQIYDYVRSHAYDCTCQVAGVDAMSIDTDWLRHAARTVRHEHRAMAERAQVAEARIQAVRAERDHARAQVDRVREMLDQYGPDHSPECGWEDCARCVVDEVHHALDGEQ